MKKNTLSWLLTLVWLGASQLLLAQNQNKIQLLDQSNNAPIPGVLFTYGEQTGISTDQGFIELTYQKEQELILSHMAFGELTFTDAQVNSAIQAKLLLLKLKSQDLHPVTVIAIKNKETGTELVKLDYQEKMDHDGGALLTRTPVIGVIKKSGSYGFDPVLRGFKFEQLNIVIDGAMTATTACPNRMDPPTSQIAPNMIDRIEILKGPYSMRFGTGIGGTVNYISTPHRFSEKSSVYGRLTGGYETNGQIARTEGLIGFSGNRYDLALFGSYSTGQNYIDGNGDEVSSSFNRGSFGANLGFLLSDNQQVSLSVTRNIAREAKFPALPMDLRSDDTWLINARHNITFKKGALRSWNTTVYTSLVKHVMDNFDKELNPRPVNAETIAETYTYGGRTEGKWIWNKAFLYAGADLRVEGAEGIREREMLMGPSAGKIFYDNAWQNSRINKTGIFGEYHLRVNTVQLIMSGRVEFNTAIAYEPSDYFLASYESVETQQINPSVSLGAVKKFDSDISLGLWLGRGQRSAGLTERYINFFPVGQGPHKLVGNPELNPEVNNEMDITFEFKREKTVINVDVFASYSTDYISSSVDTILYNTKQFVNLGEVFRTGVELSWNQKLGAGLGHYFGFAYTYGQDLERDEPLAEVAPLDFRYILYGSYVNNKLRPEVTFRYVMEQDRISTDFGETVTPAFALVDLVIAYNFSKKVSLTGGVKNIFDEAYYEHLSRSVRGAGDLPIYDPGRSIFLSFNLNFL